MNFIKIPTIGKQATVVAIPVYNIVAMEAYSAYTLIEYVRNTEIGRVQTRLTIEDIEKGIQDIIAAEIFNTNLPLGE